MGVTLLSFPAADTEEMTSPEVSQAAAGRSSPDMAHIFELQSSPFLQLGCTASSSMGRYENSPYGTNQLYVKRMIRMKITMQAQVRHAGYSQKAPSSSTPILFSKNKTPSESIPYLTGKKLSGVVNRKIRNQTEKQRKTNEL